MCKLKLIEDHCIYVSFVDVKTIEQVNVDFVGHEGITDVISFDYRDNMMPGEDVAIELIICTDKAEIEANTRHDSSFSYELVLYITHGLLHAAGEDDLTEEQRKRMRAKESEIMTELEKEFSIEDIFDLEHRL